MTPHSLFLFALQKKNTTQKQVSKHAKKKPQHDVNYWVLLFHCIITHWLRDSHSYYGRTSQDTFWHECQSAAQIRWSISPSRWEPATSTVDIIRKCQHTQGYNLRGHTCVCVTLTIIPRILFTEALSFGSVPEFIISAWIRGLCSFKNSINALRGFLIYGLSELWPPVVLFLLLGKTKVWAKCMSPVCGHSWKYILQRTYADFCGVGGGPEGRQAPKGNI